MNQLIKRTSLKKQPKWIQEGVLLGNKFHYIKQKPLIHNSINLSYLMLINVGLFILAYSGKYIAPILYIPLAIFGFGSIFFMIGVFVIHESSHNMFIVLQNRKMATKINQILGKLFAFSFGIDYINHWEIGHTIHHLNPIESNDPQNCPETIYTGINLLKYAIKIFLLPGYIHIYRRHDNCIAAKEYTMNWRLLMSLIISWTLAIVLLYFTCGWAVAVSFFLGVNIMSILNQFKIAMEHSGEIGKRENYFLRSCSYFFPFESLFMPFNVYLHFEHHLNYCVPWYLLPKYHQELLKIVPENLQKDIYKYNQEVLNQICNY